jgi:hypothetical protein
MGTAPPPPPPPGSASTLDGAAGGPDGAGVRACFCPGTGAYTSSLQSST